ncbi:polyprenyl diphosphate synthase [Oleiagrimonas citrea]|uniref:Ditrans,polycis-undecaprenyl-diphosphate synthase ((2E,6E)-farnesyl-diphosphate specific) n=1 Tax=Oleiagrimonas citrea TaxID=1665687 RepID=A0A846ZK56_9GAMM|nr:polyprenyl diphosphate synthase [Oleiagrimonas citrea]NKZ37928.1 di-trans,poly-cis-decaprenylcistransferase [Oleiagrimonas citrea]
MSTDTPSLPRHVAIIMDGNGRWAEQRRQPRSFGHRAGQKAVRQAIEHCMRRGIGALTLFAFSSENWRRPETEVSALMTLFLKALDKEVDQLHANGVCLRFIGDLSRFDAPLRERMHAARERTAGNTALHVNVAVNYGGHWDIAQAARSLAEAAARGDLDPTGIDAEMLGAHVCLADLPAPDLFIRTGGEHRISNFLLWQLAYTELVFTDTLWPDFDADCLDAALDDFAGRQRRFGRTGSQVAESTAPQP